MAGDKWHQVEWGAGRGLGGRGGRHLLTPLAPLPVSRVVVSRAVVRGRRCGQVASPLAPPGQLQSPPPPQIPAHVVAGRRVWEGGWWVVGRLVRHTWVAEGGERGEGGGVCVLFVLVGLGGEQT